MTRKGHFGDPKDTIDTKQLKNHVYLLRFGHTSALLLKKKWHEKAIFPVLGKLTHMYSCPQTSFLNVSEWAWEGCDALHLQWSLSQPQLSPLLSFFYGMPATHLVGSTSMKLETTASWVNFYLNLNNVDAPEVSNGLHVGNKHGMSCDCCSMSLLIERALWNEITYCVTYDHLSSCNGHLSGTGWFF